MKKIKPKAFIDKIPVWCSHDAIVYLDKLQKNPENPNIHPTEQIEKLARLIQGHGWRNPITVSNLSGLIVRGHGRYLAAVLAGLTQAPVDYQDYESILAETLDLIADNKIAELSHVDDELVKYLMESLDQAENFNVELAGYDPGEVLEEIGKQDEKRQPPPEVEFSREIILTHNYVVLYFDNDFDWQVAIDKFGLQKVKDLIPRKGQPTGIGRVLNGAEWVKRIK